MHRIIISEESRKSSVITESEIPLVPRPPPNVFISLWNWLSNSLTLCRSRQKMRKVSSKHLWIVKQVFFPRDLDIILLFSHLNANNFEDIVDRKCWELFYYLVAAQGEHLASELETVLKLVVAAAMKI